MGTIFTVFGIGDCTHNLPVSGRTLYPWTTELVTMQSEFFSGPLLPGRTRRGCLQFVPGTGSVVVFAPQTNRFTDKMESGRGHLLRGVGDRGESSQLVCFVPHH